MRHEKPPTGVPVYSVAYGGPFSGRHWQAYAEHGPTIGELVAATPGLPAGFDTRGEVRISGHLIPRDRWHLVRPRPSPDPLRPTYVTLHMPPRGSGSGEGGGGGKAVIGIVAALALTLATAGIASGALAAAGSIGATLTGGLFTSTGALAFLGTGIGAKALALGVGLAGALALGALTAPPTSPASRNRKTDDLGAASASGNVIGPGETLPRVIGTHRVFPAYIADAYYELVDGDETVVVVGALAGPHKLERIRIGDADVDDAEDIEVETREGWDDDAPLTLATRQSRITGSSVELSGHVLNPDSQKRLLHQSSPASDLPKWHSVATRHAPDEAHLRMDFPQGLGISDPDNEQVYVLMAMRVQIRPRPLAGETVPWINLPELFYSSRRTDAKKGVIKLIWSASEPAMPTPPQNKGWIYAYRSVPAQTATPSGTGGWTASPYFSDPSRSESYLSLGNAATSGVLHTHLTGDAATFYLDPEIFPQGVYEIRLKRGYLVSKTAHTVATYGQIVTGIVYDYFGYSTSAGVHQILNDDDYFGSAYLLRCQSVWNAHPVALTGDALIAVRAKNRGIENLSVIASGYVPDIADLGGDWITTSNPAHHYRFVLAGTLNADPLPADLVGDEAIADWRDSCTAEGYQCNALVQGEAVQDVLTAIASCGFARPRQSEVWDVYEDRDRSADAPVQVFSPRNAANFRWEKAFPRLPDGFRVTFAERSADYEERQIVVLRDGATGSNLENVTYSGLVDVGAATARARFDLAQAVARGTFYYLDAPAEAIVCRRGDLVGLTHDVLTRQAGSARIREKIVSGGTITGLVLDCAVEIAAADPAFGIVIRRQDGTLSTHPIAEGAGTHETVTLVTPIADATVTIASGFDTEDVPLVGEGEDGALVVWGPVAQEMLRMLVFAIGAPGDDLVFPLTLVDEAPELERAALGAFDAPGTRVYDIDGTYLFIVPNYETGLTVTLAGGSAGAYGITNASTFPAGTAGGDTTFDGMVAGGSPVPASRTSAALGGTASGPGTGYNGNIGAAPTVSASGAGGDAVGTTGTGGASVAVDGNGLQGSAPGAGASGARRTISGTVYATGGTGSGALKQRTYAPGDLVPGTVMAVVIGRGGLAGDGNSYDGGAGRTGSATFDWS